MKVGRGGEKEKKLFHLHFVTFTAQKTDLFTQIVLNCQMMDLSTFYQDIIMGKIVKVIWISRCEEIKLWQAGFLVIKFPIEEG